MNLWHNTRVLGMLANGLLAVAVLCLLAAGLGWLTHRPYFELRTVDIGAENASHPLRHVPKPLLAQAIREAEYGNFFTIDMKALRSRIESVPWVRQATLRRVWPDRLIVLIEEHRPYAIWEDGRLINSYGELYSANLDEAEADGPLPQLGGPKGSELSVVERYAELSSLTKSLEMVPVAVSLSDRGAWSATMDDGTELLIGRDSSGLNGRQRGDDVAERVERWVRAYPLVTERIQRRAAVIDLRYANGFSVRSLEKLAEAFDIDDLITDALDRDKATRKKPSGNDAGNADTPFERVASRSAANTQGTANNRVPARTVPTGQGRQQ
ncbi:MAG: cell division protein FtsQ/DivIB [Burkholderiaceae bacterium]